MRDGAVPPVGRFLASARREFDAAHDWYAERSVPAAEGFAREVERVVRAIAEKPELGRVVRVRRDGSVVRVRPCRGYPYAVARCSRGGVQVILAVAHARRRPGYWLYRLANA